MNTLIRLRPNSIVLGLMGRVNYAWAQLDLISTAAFASLLNLDPVELGMAIGRIETQAKIEKMREISRHRGADELSAFFANIKSQLKRLRPDRNAVTHGAYMGKTHKGELLSSARRIYRSRGGADHPEDVCFYRSTIKAAHRGRHKNCHLPP